MGTLLQVLGTEIQEQLKLSANNPAESNRKDELSKKVLRREKLQRYSNTSRPTSMSRREYLYLQSECMWWVAEGFYNIFLSI